MYGEVFADASQANHQAKTKVA